MVGYAPDQDSLARKVAIVAVLVIEGIDTGFYSWAKNEGLLEEPKWKAKHESIASSL